jgi:hypothetical protein
MVSGSGPNDPAMAETQDLAAHAVTLNLGSKFNKAAAPKYTGGTQIWIVFDGPISVWKNIAEDIKNNLTLFALEDLHSKHSNLVHNLAMKGKNHHGLRISAHLVMAKRMESTTSRDL